MERKFILCLCQVLKGTCKTIGFASFNPYYPIKNNCNIGRWSRHKYLLASLPVEPFSLVTSVTCEGGRAVSSKTEVNYNSLNHLLTTNPNSLTLFSVKPNYYKKTSHAAYKELAIKNE